MLHEFLSAHTPEILARAHALVVKRPDTPTVTGAALTNGVPLLLAQIVDRLRAGADGAGDPIGGSAKTYGRDLLDMGFNVGQVVHGYGDVCQAVTSLADDLSAPITADEFHTFNRCLDNAIAAAVTSYEQQRDHRRDASAVLDQTEREGSLSHELRNRIGTALLSYNILREGTLGIGGTTGAILGRSLRAMRDLVNNSVAGVRLESGVAKPQRVSLSKLIGEVHAEAALDASAGGFQLAVSPVADEIEVAADPQILSAAIANLLQNAFKFTHSRGRVELRASATADRVLIDVEDQCGGLPAGTLENLFRPFDQGSSTRPGLGLGLTISRRGVEAMGGVLCARDLPGKGCVFTIDLPRLVAA
jgi:signal transduction histidine kinase